MKKFVAILAGLVLLALLLLVLFLFLRPGTDSPAANAPAPAPAAANATLAALLPANTPALSANGTAPAAANATTPAAANATTPAAANATTPAAANATTPAAANATTPGAAAGNATAGAAGPPPVPHDLVAGAFLAQAVANATLTDLRARGLAPALFVRPDGAGATWWEVHLGRFPDLAAAEAEADRLGAKLGVWTRPRPVDPAAKPVAAAKGPATVYLVGAGEYLTLYAARERVRELAALGLEPFVVRTPGEGGQMWYVVAVGQAKSEEEAATLAADLAAKTGLPGRVTAEDAASLAGRRVAE